MPWTCLAPDPCVSVQLDGCKEPLPCCKVRLCRVATPQRCDGTATLCCNAEQRMHRARAHAHAEADSPTHQTDKQTHRQPHARECEQTHARTHGSRRESTALRCEKTRSGGSSGVAMRGNRRCGGATDCDALQQVLRRCNRCCVVATRRASLQQDVLRCSRYGCIVHKMRTSGAPLSATAHRRRSQMTESSAV